MNIKNILIKTFIPFVILYTPAYFVANHFLGDWGFLAILYGYLMYGALTVWDSYYELRKAGRLLNETLANLSDKEIDTATAAYIEYYPEHSEVVSAEVAKFRKLSGRQ